MGVCTWHPRPPGLAPLEPALRTSLRIARWWLVYEAELGFPVEAALDGLDGLLELLAAARSRGDMVDALAMTHGGPRCCVEVLTTAGNRHLGTLLDEVLAFGLALDARPHWGQVLPAQPGRLARLYPRFDDWHQQVRRLDPCGRFSNDLLRELEAHRHG